MNILLTLDYELYFGSNSGTQDKSIIYPTNRVLTILDEYNIKASFFVDSGYLIKLNEYRKQYEVLEDDYGKIISQIKSLSDNGHDIQLHIHPHWEDSYYNGSKWILDTTRYRLHEFSEVEIDDIVYRHKTVLTDIVGDKVFAYRAGGWCIQPFDKLKNALKKHDIWLDSTVFEGGKNKSATHYFDFTNAPKKDIWRFEDDPLVENQSGSFTEVPIGSHRVSPLFFWKLAFAKKLGGDKHKGFGDGSAAGGSKWNKIRMLARWTHSVVSVDGYKASYLQDAFGKFCKNKDNKYFVIIGHPKAMSEYSLKKLEEFIEKNKENNFITYSKLFMDGKS
ncbi:MAG: polysaccharide deacetylase family protein [Sulfurovaceae bacterium]